MVVVTSNNLTLADWSKRVGPDNTIPVIAELLSQTNEILTDAVFKAGNLPTGDRVVIRTGLPSVYYRALNQGVPPSKSTTAQVDEACSILEARSEVDIDLAMLNGNTDEFRMSEDSAFLEAMNQAMALGLIYGNPAADPKQFLGLSGRFSNIGAQNGQNILDAGGDVAATNASIWLVGWGDNTVYCPFPKGSVAGLLHENLDRDTIQFSDGTRMEALVSRFQWKNGLVVKDWRYVVRIANIKVADLIAQTGTQTSAIGTNIMKLMARAMYRVPNLSYCRPVFYMNRTVHSGLAMAALDKSQNALAVQDGLSQFGRPMSWLSFLGIPLRRVDQLLNTETKVTATS